MKHCEFIFLELFYSLFSQQRTAVLMVFLTPVSHKPPDIRQLKGGKGAPLDYLASYLASFVYDC